MQTQVQRKTLDLLNWIKTHGLCPSQPTNRDRFLCPFTLKILAHNRLNDHQKRTALWIPTVQGLEELGLELEVEDLGGMKMITDRHFIGAGVGESEAALSFLNELRKETMSCC